VKLSEPTPDESNLIGTPAAPETAAVEPTDTALAAEDFRAIGVVPAETRAVVIRHAASQASKSLATHQLSSPDPRTERKLLRVALSTYRLLDPRRRENARERAHVGRIRPTTLLTFEHAAFADESLLRNPLQGCPSGFDTIPESASIATAPSLADPSQVDSLVEDTATAPFDQESNEDGGSSTSSAESPPGTTETTTPPHRSREVSRQEVGNADVHALPSDSDLTSSRQTSGKVQQGSLLSHPFVVLAMIVLLLLAALLVSFWGVRYRGQEMQRFPTTNSQLPATSSVD
jgi:hypothetical protein